jgi:hypothetical protein
MRGHFISDNGHSLLDLQASQPVLDNAQPYVATMFHTVKVEALAWASAG